jgi:TRAP-type mannitol/chloroaromatic compound transport system permease small subunit
MTQSNPPSDNANETTAADAVAKVVAPVVISDPSEVNRENHNWADSLMLNVGNTVAWILPTLMLAIVAQVLMRKAGFNQAWLDDGQWWMYGFAMLTAFGYAITTESHVRVDILHQNFSPTKKAKIEIFALGWFLLPFIAIMTDILIQYSWASFVAKEGSDSPNGLHRLYLLKMSLPVLFGLAGLAAWAAMKRNFKTIGIPHFWKLMLCALPFCIFVFERLAHNVLYWYIQLTNPDMKPRLIAKEPLLENSLWIGLAVLVVVLIWAYIKRGQSHTTNTATVEA